MGASSSSEMGASASAAAREQQEEEGLAASTGSLPMLQEAFAKLSLPQTKAIPAHSLQDILCLNLTNILSESSLPMPESFPQLLVNLGPTIVELFFEIGKEGICWVDFLKGYNRCCGRMPASLSLNNLYKLYSATGRKAGIPSDLAFDSDNCKISGNLKSTDVLMLLWMCWIMAHSSKISKIYKEEATLVLPDMHHLITSAFISCNETNEDSSVRDCTILGFEKKISAQKLHLWALTTVPGLAHCFIQYVEDRLQTCLASKDDLDSSVLLVGDNSSVDVCDTCLLTCGRAWAISLTLRSTMNEELLGACIPRKDTGTLEKLLYRSSIHGKGLSRFWSNVEGYHGPSLLLVSASSPNTSEKESSPGRWVIGILTGQGFENKDTFYGSFGYLYSLSPIFRVFLPSGKEKNFVYSHRHPPARVYDPHPKPIGLAFGGTVGNERIFIDEDFARVAIRHHAVDKTYQPGSLIPNQGFLAIEAFILEVEVWGLGGKAAKERQGTYKKRELLFSEQRRKVDMKTFASWEDSPEKMMMDMVADPNRVHREDR